MFPTFDLAPPAATVLPDIRHPLQRQIGSHRRLDQPALAVETDHADAARLVDGHTGAAMCAEILAPVVRTHFVSDPQAALAVISNRRIRFVERRSGRRYLRAPLLGRSGGADINIVAA